MGKRRMSVGRLLMLPLPYAVILGLYRAVERQMFDVWGPFRSASYVWGMAGATGIALILLCHPTGPQLRFAFLGIASGVGAGFLLTDTCSPFGIFVGPVLGFLIASLGGTNRYKGEKLSGDGTLSHDDEGIRWVDGLDAATPSDKLPPPVSPIQR